MLIALIGVIPPGLLNMTAAKISIKEGYSRGLMFSIGVCVVVIIQTLIAVIFARYLSKHPEIVQVLQRVAFVLFVLITIYFLALAKQQPKLKVEQERRSKHSRFFQGMFLSSLNVFPIPYQAYMSVTLASLGWLTFDNVSITSYVAGAATGTFVMLYVYVFFFKRIKNKKIKSQKNMNYIIGIITGIISIVTLINIIKDL
ncbi:threonine/homoserine/homoserine lactone efflux protein [Olleya aquimaris]|uniref:Threonine/homoserine/homoserine lactone efflux protein n=2 Tax=Olleya aquimaris TaxID=639310 RepID=A0A327RX12_9FLAO|nr:threonine/homoserine/homoserine lactone efflux protein [Olleya aquimaris]